MICRKKSKADAKHSQKCGASAFFLYINMYMRSYICLFLCFCNIVAYLIPYLCN